MKLDAIIYEQEPQEAIIAEDQITIILQPSGAQGPQGPIGPQGPAGSAATDTITHTTASLAAGATESNTAALGKTTLLSRIVTTQPARIRLYATSALRDADLARPIGTLPSGNHGLLFEAVTTYAILDLYVSPAVAMYSATSQVAISVTNMHDASAQIAVSMTRTLLEA